MAHEFPTQETMTQQASTSKVVVKDFPCQLSKGLADELEREKLLTKPEGSIGVKHCTLNPRQPLSPAEGRLLSAALDHVKRSSPENATFEARYAMQALTAVVNSSAVSRFAAQLVGLSGRAHPDRGWEGDGPFQRTWHEGHFTRYGVHDRVSQSDAEVAWRRRVAERLETYPTVVRGNPLCRHARVHTVFHACRSVDTALSICRTGFAALASLDAGYYAQGLYFTLDLDYAVRQYGLDMLDAEGRATVLVRRRPAERLSLTSAWWLVNGHPSPRVCRCLQADDCLRCGRCAMRRWATCIP